MTEPTELDPDVVAYNEAVDRYKATLAKYAVKKARHDELMASAETSQANAEASHACARATLDEAKVVGGEMDALVDQIEDDDRVRVEAWKKIEPKIKAETARLEAQALAMKVAAHSDVPATVQ